MVPFRLEVGPRRAVDPVKDAHKRHIKGWRGKGFTCPCCREVKKAASHKLARLRLKREDEKNNNDHQHGEE